MDYGQRNSINNNCYGCKYLGFWGMDMLVVISMIVLTIIRRNELWERKNVHYLIVQDWTAQIGIIVLSVSIIEPERNKVMKWHTYMMIAWSISYMFFRIYFYSKTITRHYLSKPRSWKSVVIRRIADTLYLLKRYFEVYKFKHLKLVAIVWLIYGGIFLW